MSGARSGSARRVQDAEPARPALALGVPVELVEAVAARVAKLLELHMAPAADPWLNTGQAAEYLGCGPDRIHDLKGRGLVEYRKDGTRLLFRRSWLDRYVDGAQPD